MAVAASLDASGLPLLVATVIDQPILIIVYGITLASSGWLFRDARRRQRSFPVAAGWAIGGLVLPGIVHFGYLYGRLQDETESPTPGDND